MVGKAYLQRGLIMALGQNQWYHFGVGAPPILVYFSGDWDDPWPYLGKYKKRRGMTECVVEWSQLRPM